MKHDLFWMVCAAIGASTAILGGVATAALAQPSPLATVVGDRAEQQQRNVRVSYRDLDLAEPQGVRLLNRRVGRATTVACGPDENMVGDPAFSNCVRDAWKRARPQIALAVERGRQIASTGTSSIPLVAIAVGGVR